MSKSLAASNKVMKNYLSELMTDEVENEKPQSTYETKVDNQQLEQLLSKVSAKEAKTTLTTHKSENQYIEPTLESVDNKAVIEDSPAITNTSLLVEQDKNDVPVKKARTFSRESFQAMFFDVAGLTVAVPLIELGGIHNIGETTHLMGKPDWFKGVMLNRDEKISVVDTARWVMPEKYDETLKNSLNYQYIIMLSDSHWGLSAERLIDTVTLQEDDIKWLDTPNKRPWLAGLVKDRMCALLDVESLIQLLNQGENIHQK